MREQGLTSFDVKEILKDLEVRDYSIGPCSNDVDLPNRNDVWKFGKTVQFDEESFELYIKLAIGESKNTLGCICISFHPCEHPINYPFR